MTFGQSVKTCFKKYCVFKGRATRSEYWYFTLFVFLVGVGLSFVQGLCSIPVLFSGGKGSETINTVFLILSAAFELLILLPSLAVLTRRLHDTNRSGWWLVGIYSILAVGLIALMGGVAPDLIAGKEPDFSSMTMTPAMVIGLCACLLALVWDIIFIVWCCMDSKPGLNKYGPNPKGIDTTNSVEQSEEQ